jgi:hypothetical protein
MQVNQRQGERGPHRNRAGIHALDAASMHRRWPSHHGSENCTTHGQTHLPHTGSLSRVGLLSTPLSRPEGKRKRRKEEGSTRGRRRKEEEKKIKGREKRTADPREPGEKREKKKKKKRKKRATVVRQRGRKERKEERRDGHVSPVGFQKISTNRVLTRDNKKLHFILKFRLLLIILGSHYTKILSFNN